MLEDFEMKKYLLFIFTYSPPPSIVTTHKIEAFLGINYVFFFFTVQNS
jgi:hypothetical protein